MGAFATQAQETERYIEVTGTSEIEIVPDKIHYIIEIREYFNEEFDKRSKPEEYRTKVPLAEIEKGLRKALAEAGIEEKAIMTEEVGNYWRERGMDFLVSKRFDISLKDFDQINDIIKRIDTKGVNTMRIGNLENKDLLEYHKKGKTAALKAAKEKADYLTEAMGQKTGKVLRIVEQSNGIDYSFAQSNVMRSDAGSFDTFRTIKKSYSMTVRFEIDD